MSIISLKEPLDPATIAANAERQLQKSPYYYLKGVRCRVERGVLTLEGRVPLGPLRQIAELIVLRVDGVREVVNRVEVYDPQRASA